MSRKTKRLQRQDEEALLAVLATPDGRRVLWAELGEAGVFRATFSTDPIAMAYNEGRRSRGLEMLDRILDLAPHRYLEMMREHQPAGRLPGEERPPDEDEADDRPSDT